MKFGEKFNFKLEKIDDGVKLTIKNIPQGIAITAMDFGRDLAKRTMEGYSPNPDEEIDVLSGIENEKTTGEDIVFSYIKGTYESAMILAGTIGKKILDRKVISRASEIGGITVGEKNEAYIRVAVQKMAMTNDSLGSVGEIDLPFDTDMDRFKGVFANYVFSIIPEVEAIQYGLGIGVGKKSAENLGIEPKKAIITFGPHRERKIPALSAVYDIVLESIAVIALINM
ncbi:chorismate synthase [Cetobacterium ceti]|uniref:Chorismate synthase n=1 Tax=Cetobacterium ceti TaxID=180163 RepID=A0A1T4N8E4_9FUSO|nr:hypothetical protein [Cetobacterium ceti]SJZ75489.1 chorismate synthase [Cetobacterium ceti]